MRLCSVADCGYKHSAKGYCEAHYQLHRKGRDVNVRIKRRHETGGVCEVSWCDRPAARPPLCGAHYLRKMRGADMETPFRRIAPGVWSDWAPTSDGYIRRHRAMDGKQEYEIQHRVVMEEELGRKLLSDESVHHKNGDRADNRPENLELWSRYQPAGQRVEDKLAWAAEIIERYGHLDRQIQAQLALNRSLKEQ